MIEAPAPRVTVLVGCWNNAQTLGAAVDSILTQTLRSLELIIVDDGSTDRTPELAEAYARRDRRVGYLRLPHRGISHSLDAGIAAARGDLVAFQDADDTSFPERLSQELAVFDARPEVVVVGCRMLEVGPDGHPLRPRTRFVAGDLNAVLMKFNPIPNSCAMVRRTALTAVGGFDTRYRYAMDYDLWLRLAEIGVVTTVDQPLAVRRMSGANVAARKERAQTAEAILIRARAIRRRHQLRAGSALAVPLLALATPLWLKRLRRRVLRQAP